MRMSRWLVLNNAFQKNLYSKGVENTDITGGFATYAYVPDTSTNATQKLTVTKNSDSITLKSAAGYGGSLFSENTINLTHARVLKMEVSAANPNGGYINVGVSATKQNKFVRTAHALVEGSGTISVDVSQLSGSYYMFINLRGSTVQTMTFTNWWIE